MPRERKPRHLEYNAFKETLIVGLINDGQHTNRVERVPWLYIDMYWIQGPHRPSWARAWSVHVLNSRSTHPFLADLNNLKPRTPISCVNLTYLRSSYQVSKSVWFANWVTPVSYLKKYSRDIVLVSASFWTSEPFLRCALSGLVQFRINLFQFLQLFAPPP